MPSSKSSFLVSKVKNETATHLKKIKKKHKGKAKKIQVETAKHGNHQPVISGNDGELKDGEKKKRKKKKEKKEVENNEKSEECQVQKSKTKKGIQRKDQWAFEEGDQDVCQMQVQKKRKKSYESEKETHQEGAEHKHKSKKKKKSKHEEKSDSSKRKSKDNTHGTLNSDDEGLQKKLKKQKRKKELEIKEPSERKRSHEVASEKDNKQEPKKKKKHKPETEGDTVYDQDINPIHYEWIPSEEIKEKFKLRQGKWTKTEEKILKENMERYLSANSIDDPSKLIFAYLHNSETVEGQIWKEFARTTNFYRELGRGLNRSLFFVYRKVLRSFDQGNYLGKFSEFEDRELQKLVALHGRKWEKIGRMMERSGMAVCHRFDWITGERGTWKDSEIDLLREAVREVTNTVDGEEVFTNINWSAVASIVKTRNRLQCRKKWLLNICWKDCKLSTLKKWGAEEDLQLIRKVYESSVTEICDIDWHNLQKDFEMARSPEWLQMKFKVILKKYCKSIDFDNTDFEDVIDYLYNVKSKELQDRCFDHQDTSSE
jgi:hypothetical protein